MRSMRVGVEEGSLSLTDKAAVSDRGSGFGTACNDELHLAPPNRAFYKYENFNDVTYFCLFVWY